MSLNNLIQAGLLDYREIIEDISKKADKYWSYEKKLKEIESTIRQL